MPDRMKPLPIDFPNKGRYYTFDKRWNRSGYADTPQYSGQQPIRYPEGDYPDDRRDTALGIPTGKIKGSRREKRV
jgi:hypothetical protein